MRFNTKTRRHQDATNERIFSPTSWCLGALVLRRSEDQPFRERYSYRQIDSLFDVGHHYVRHQPRRRGGARYMTAVGYASSAAGQVVFGREVWALRAALVCLVALVALVGGRSTATGQCIDTGSTGCTERGDCCQAPAGDCVNGKCCSDNGMSGGTCTDANDCCMNTATCGLGGFCCVPTGSTSCDEKSDCCQYPAGECNASGKCCSDNGQFGGTCTDASDCCTDTATCGSGGFCCVPTGSTGCDEKSDCCQSTAECNASGKCCLDNGQFG